jgi:hypothetical protein
VRSNESRRPGFGLLVVLASAAVLIAFQTTARPAEAPDVGPHLALRDVELAYHEIRNLSLDSALVLPIESCLFTKDAGTFALESGRLWFFKPVLGKVVGAFFQGEGTFTLSTASAIEGQQIQRFTERNVIGLKITSALFVFTDSTFENLTSRLAIGRERPDGNTLRQARTIRQTVRQRFSENVDARILRDLVMGRPGRFFQAYLECPEDEHYIFSVDPLEEEEVSFHRYRRHYSSKRAVSECWYSAHALNSPSERQKPFDTDTVRIDAVIDKGARLAGTARLHFISPGGGARLVPMNLSSHLRVDWAVLNSVDSCLVIQEPDELDGALWVGLPDTLLPGSTYNLSLAYSGKDVIEDVGSSNFIVTERAAWYPRLPTWTPDPARFIMRFKVPKGLELLATGKLVRSWEEPDLSCSEWDSEFEFTLAGFNYGRFELTSENAPSGEISCFTNIHLSNELLEFRRMLEASPGLRFSLEMLPQDLTTQGVGRNAAIESRNAYETYTKVFGPIPFKHVVVSQQGQESFAQSWPGLVYLPFTSFLAPDVKEKLGLLSGEREILWYEIVGAHEMAHQWWGHTVIPASYHDNWLSEGFATYSAALYLQVTAGNEKFVDYMNMLLGDILRGVHGGRRATDLGPIWLGYRLTSIGEPGGSLLVYSKGAYVLHMLRMMLYDYKANSDTEFIAMMQDYVASRSGKPTSTEDFKAIVEKHFGTNMDWFFDQWVYGTAVPTYEIKHNTVRSDDGTYLLNVTVTQRGVGPSFTMPLHLIIEFETGHAVASILVTGSDPVVREFRLPSEPKSIVPNPWNGVLCEIKD